MVRKYYICFFCLYTSFSVWAQSTSSPDPEMLIAHLFRQQQTDNLAYSDFYESLLQFYLQKLDLNSASVEELRNLYLLNDKQISDLEQHLQKYGPLLSFHELQSISSFDLETIRNISPFVTVKSEEGSWKHLLNSLKSPDQHYLMFRQALDLQQAKGYQTNGLGVRPYAGDPQNLYLRYRYQKYRKYSFGITSEKDAGEALAWNPTNKQYGADFVSFHAMVHQIGPIKRLVVGDYQLQFGQGLVMSGGFFIGKGTETILSIRRNTTGIRPYTSLLETNYLRGISFTLGNRRWDFTPFVSHKYIDGNLQTESLYDDDLAVLQYTGLHRTVFELQSRSSVEELLYGMGVHYSSLNKRLQFGANGMNIHYSKTLQSADKLYNLYEFNGNNNSNGSVYYSYYWRNLSLFGEFAGSSGGGKGIIQGLLLSLGSKVDLSIAYRKYTPDLHVPYGNAFGENYKNSNEEGIYWGLKIRLSTKTELTCYYDIYRFPWLKYRVSVPSVGYEYFVNLMHKFSKKTIATLRFRREYKEKDTYIESSEPYLSLHCRTNLMAQLDYKADKHWYMRSRLQASSYQQATLTTHGFLLEQDLGYDGRKIDLSTRIVLFDTDDFENRQYTYEKDVLYAFSFPFFSGKGMRQYVVARYNLSKKLSFWLKYGRTVYFDRQEVGSGNDATQGNVRSEIRWQCRYSF